MTKDYLQKLPSIEKLEKLSSDSDIEIIEDGKKIVKPEVLSFITQLATLSQLSKIRRSLEIEHIEGRVVEIIFNATEEPEEWEYSPVPLATASFVNDGSDTAYISINTGFNYKELRNGESMSVDFTKAEKRIEFVFYKCNKGETASIRMTGKY